MFNHRWIVFFIELVLNAHAVDLAEWSVIPSSSLPRLPRPEYGAALCVLNESMQTLHILGGQQNQMQWIEYHLADNTVIDHGDNALPDNIAAVEASTPIREHSANYWTQLDGVLYYILEPEDWNAPFKQRKYTIHHVNVNAIGEPNSMQYWQTVPYATQTHDHCIASHANKLVVVGGMYPEYIYHGVPNMAVYDFTTQQWMTGPSMKQPRQEPSCVVNTAENALYVSGGFDDSVPLNSIEKVSLTDIASQSWSYSSGSLTVAMYGHVMVYYPDDNTILVIGGWDHSIARDEIQRIDCETDEVTVIGALEYAVARPAFVYISHLRRIYLFGGKVADGQGTDRMQIIRALVPTNEPTAAPTSNPSASPSSTPATETTLTTTATATGTEYRVTIEFRSAPCADILEAVADALNASFPQVTVDEEACEDDDDVGEEGSDATTTATLLVAIADVQLDTDVIQSTLREAMVQEYGEDIVDVGVEEEEKDEEDPQSHAGVTTMNMVAGGLIGAFLCGICGGAFCWYYTRRMRRRHVQQLAVIVAQQQQQPEQQPQPQQPHQEVGIEMVPGAVAEPGAYHDNADVDDEKEDKDDDDSAGDENDKNAAVTPGIHQVATFVAGAEENSEQLYDNSDNNNNNDVVTRNPTPTNDPKLGVYELNNMVDL